VSQEEGLTYAPSRYNPPLGHAGFDVWLSDKPTARYFDPYRVLFPVEISGVRKRQTVEHPWAGAPAVRFAIGRIRIEAHDGDYEEIFTFGGSAAVAVESGYTVCRATSTAPFLPLTDDPRSPMTLLESELEVILAQARVRWGNTEYAHLDRLNQVDPLALFRASLQAVERRVAPLLRVEADDGLRQVAHLALEMREQLARAGDWPAVIPELEELL